MKTTSTLMAILCLAAAAVLAVCLRAERQACAQLVQQNNALRQQLSAQERVVVETQQLSNQLAQADSRSKRSPAPSAEAVATETPAQEIARLRTELQSLQQQSREREQQRAAGTAPGAARPGAGSNSGAASSTGLEIVQASYFTARTNLDVTDALRQRIRGDTLNAIASNNLNGDPEYGQVKHLTIIYRVGGVLMTNEYNEGAFVALPQE